MYSPHSPSGTPPGLLPGYSPSGTPPPLPESIQRSFRINKTKKCPPAKEIIIERVVKKRLH